MSEGVFDRNIEELMQVALRKPEPHSTPVVGLGAMWLASELWTLQEQHAQKVRQNDETTKRDGSLHCGADGSL